MDAVTGLAATLQAYGAWGIVAVLLVTLGYLYRARERDRADSAKQIQALNDRLISTVESVTEIMTENRVLVQKLEVILQQHFLMRGGNNPA